MTRPRPTTIVDAPRLSKKLGANLVLASETLQYTGSFKFRAAYNVASNVKQAHIITASSGNFGQVIRKNYPVIIGNKVQGTEKEIVSVVGPLCTPLDILADQMQMAKASVGDLVVVLQSGAYGLTASPTAFLNHPMPLEVLV